MSEPWYDANYWGWLPGTALGVAGGMWGTLVGVLAQRGKCRGMVFAAYWGFLIVGAAFLIAGIVGAASGQPYGVWYGLLLPGVITTIVIGPLGFVARNAYRRAEALKMRAQEFEG